MRQTYCTSDIPETQAYRSNSRFGAAAADLEQQQPTCNRYARERSERAKRFESSSKAKQHTHHFLHTKGARGLSPCLLKRWDQASSTQCERCKHGWGEGGSLLVAFLPPLWVHSCWWRYFCCRQIIRFMERTMVPPGWDQIALWSYRETLLPGRAQQPRCGPVSLVRYVGAGPVVAACSRRTRTQRLEHGCCWCVFANVGPSPIDLSTCCACIRHLPGTLQQHTTAKVSRPRSTHVNNLLTKSAESLPVGQSRRNRIFDSLEFDWGRERRGMKRDGC